MTLDVFGGDLRRGKIKPRLIAGLDEVALEEIGAHWRTLGELGHHVNGGMFSFAHCSICGIAKYSG